MRLQLSTTATFVEENTSPLPEFGTGLRGRLELVQAFTPLAPAELDPVPCRRDVSPELMLVSPQPDDRGSVLAELLGRRVREARREPLGVLLAEAGLLDEAEIDLALSAARRSGRRLGEVLIEYGLVTSTSSAWSPSSAACPSST